MYNDEIFIEEFVFQYRIESIEKQDDSFFKIRDRLSESLRYYIFLIPNREYTSKRPIEEMVNDRIESFFAITQNTKAYVTKFEEKEGSYFLEFTVLIISTLANYGSIRESIDYIRNDFKDLFITSLGEDHTVEANVHSNDIAGPRAKTVKRSFVDEILFNLSQLNYRTILVFSVIVGLTYAFFNSLQQQTQDTNIGKNLSEKEIEYLIDKKMEDAIRDKKMDFLIDKYEQILNDSTSIKTKN